MLLHSESAILTEAKLAYIQASLFFCRPPKNQHPTILPITRSGVAPAAVTSKGGNYRARLFLWHRVGVDFVAGSVRYPHGGAV